MSLFDVVSNRDSFIGLFNLFENLGKLVSSFTCEVSVFVSPQFVLAKLWSVSQTNVTGLPRLD